MNQINFQTGIIDLSSQGAPVTKGGDMERFTHVDFPKPFPDGSKVGVVPMTQSFHGPDTPGLRIAHVTTTGFKIRMNELVHSTGGKENQTLSDGNHLKEKIAWIAFTEGATQGDPGHSPHHHHLWHGTLEANEQQGAQTGVTLHEGEVISITVTGSASAGSGYPMVGPEGDPHYHSAYHLSASANLGAVLMKIGDGDTYTLVGSGLPHYTVQKDGVITFFYNDSPGHFGDNTGSFEITLSKK